MSDTAQSSVNSIVLMDSFNFQELLSSVRLPLSRTAIDVPIFSRPDMESISSMRNGALNFEGFQMGDKESYKTLLSQQVGSTNSRHALLYADQGDLVGSPCWLLDSHNNSVEVGGVATGAVMITGVFAATGGARYGNILHGCHQEGFYFEPGYYEIVLRSVPGTDNLIVGASGSNLGGAPVQLNDFADSAAINAGFKSVFEGLSSFNGRVFTVTNTLVKTGANWSGILKCVISGEKSPFPRILHAKAGTIAVGVGKSNLVYEGASGTGISVNDAPEAISSGNSQRIKLEDVNPLQFLAVRAAGTNPHSPDFTLSSYIAGGVFNTTTFRAYLKTQIEALAAYTGRTVTITVTTAFTQNNGLWSGALNVAFNGSSGATQLEAIGGAIRRFLVTVGDAGNYSADGGANFNLGISQAAFQANQRAINAAHAALIAIGNSSAAGISANLMVGGSSTASGTSNGVTDGAILFNNIGGNSLSNTAGVPLKVTYDRGVGNAVVVNKVRLVGLDWNSYSSFRVRGSNTGAFTGEEVLLLDTVPTNANATEVALGDTACPYEFANSTAYRYYRYELIGTANNVRLYEIQAFQVSTAAADFYTYFPVDAAPTGPTRTGTNSTYTIVSAPGISNTLTFTNNGKVMSTRSGYTAHLHIVGYKGNGTQSITVKIQHSSDGVSWSDLLTFNALNSKGYERKVSVDNFVEVKQFRRAAWTVTGGGGQFAFAVGLSSYGKNPL